MKVHSLLNPVQTGVFKVPRFKSITRDTQLTTGSDFFCRSWRNTTSGPRIVAENQTAFAVFDGYPVNPGHTLIVPKRHVASFFDTTPQEKHDLLGLLETSRHTVQNAFSRKGQPIPQDWNIGINDGRLAGRTVDHLHVHLIPRFPGDMADPKGGVRGVIPEKQQYSGPPDPTVDTLLD